MVNFVHGNDSHEQLKKEESEDRLNPRAPHNYRTISLRLNRWEAERLNAAAEEADRTRTDFVRWAMHQKMMELL